MAVSTQLCSPSTSFSPLSHSDTLCTSSHSNPLSCFLMMLMLPPTNHRTTALELLGPGRHPPGTTSSFSSDSRPFCSFSPEGKHEPKAGRLRSAQPTPSCSHRQEEPAPKLTSSQKKKASIGTEPEGTQISRISTGCW